MKLFPRIILSSLFAYSIFLIFSHVLPPYPVIVVFHYEILIGKIVHYDFVSIHCNLYYWWLPQPIVSRAITAITANFHRPKELDALHSCCRLLILFVNCFVSISLLGTIFLSSAFQALTICMISFLIRLVVKFLIYVTSHIRIPREIHNHYHHQTLFPTK